MVTGGTGFVGSAIVRELLSRGERVAVMGRDASRIRQQFDNSVDARRADVSDVAALEAAMQGIDTVVNAVQFPNNPIERKSKGWTFEEVDYKGTVNQVNAAKAAGVKRFVYVSGVGAAADAPQHWFRFKWQAEQHLQQSGLDWAVLRPTWVFGPGDHSLNKLIGFTKFLPFLPLFGDGQQAMQPVFVDDVGRAAADLALKPDVTGKVYEIGGPERMTMDEVLKTALSVLGRKRFILHQPVFVGKALGTVAGLLPFAPLTADAVEFIVQPAVADNSALEHALAPKLTPLREGLETYLK
ncbi:MAG TPA: complex I NDUFA9 subunit family protein [Dehalococcoidia bacterium]